MCRKANRKSQKLSFLYKNAGKVSKCMSYIWFYRSVSKSADKKLMIFFFIYFQKIFLAFHAS